MSFQEENTRLHQSWFTTLLIGPPHGLDLNLDILISARLVENKSYGQKMVLVSENGVDKSTGSKNSTVEESLDQVGYPQEALPTRGGVK